MDGSGLVPGVGLGQSWRSARLAQPPLNARRLGRYPTILMSLLGLTIFGFGAAFVNTFHQYLFFRFGVSQALMCYAISSVCLGEVPQPSAGGGGGASGARGGGRGERGGGAGAYLPGARWINRVAAQ